MSEQEVEQQAECVSIEISQTDFTDETTRLLAVRKLLDFAVDDDRYERPHISVVRAVMNIVLPLAVVASLFCALYFTLNIHRLSISLGVSWGLLGVYVVLRLRDIFIWSIRVYQRFAPIAVRRRCVFTPTCSQYAIQALQCYGVIRGVPKIISRLRRCHLPNGGEDQLK